MANFWSLRKMKPSKSDLPQNGTSIRKPRTNSSRRPSNVFSELYLTENKYIKDLSIIVEEYIPRVLNSENPKPEDLSGKAADLVFGNIKSIFQWHNSEFLTVISRCLKDPSKFGIKMEEIEETMLALYVIYFKNKPISEFIVNKHERFFENIVMDKSQKLFHIKTYLQLPVDRIFKYKILFSSILKYENNHKDEINRAIQVMERIMSALNNLMVLWRLENFPENIDDQGNLIRHKSLFCNQETNGNKWLNHLIGASKRKFFHVFLLQGCIIFANIKGIGNSFNEETYEYCFHLKVNQIILLKGLSDKILLKVRDSKKKNTTCFIIQINDKETYAEWMHAITEAISYQEKFKFSILEPTFSEKMFESANADNSASNKK